MRELGRLLLKLKKTTYENLSKFIGPGYFVVQAAKTIVGFDPVTNQLAIPSMALKLGASLNKCALLVQSNTLKIYDENAYKLYLSNSKL